MFRVAINGVHFVLPYVQDRIDNRITIDWYIDNLQTSVS